MISFSLSKLVLVLMVTIAPATPWRESYPETAQGIADAVEESEPLFAGDDGRMRTAALLVSLAYFESTFKPSAVGDRGSSLGLFQTSRHWVRMSADEYLRDAKEQAKTALALVRESFSACAARPLDARLAWYASGSCSRGGAASTHRVGLAKRLLAP